MGDPAFTTQFLAASPLDPDDCFTTRVRYQYGDLLTASGA